MKKAIKKKSEKRNSGKQPLKKLTSVNDDKNQHEEEEKKDFGGLPERDLKKNLGCG